MSRRDLTSGCLFTLALLAAPLLGACSGATAPAESNSVVESPGLAARTPRAATDTSAVSLDAAPSTLNAAVTGVPLLTPHATSNPRHKRTPRTPAPARDPYVKPADVELGAWEPGWVAWDVDVDPTGRYAYVAGGGNGFSVVDLVDPANPTEIGRWADADGCWACPDRARGRSTARQVVADPSGVYMAIDNGVVRLDVSDPTAPQRIASTSVGFTFGWHTRIAVDDMRLFGDSLPDRPGIIDLHDPVRMYESTELRDVPADWHDVTASGNRLYVAHGEDGLRIYSITDDPDLVAVGRLEPVWSAERLAVAEGYAYVLGDGPSGALHVVDVSNPARPVEIGEYDPTEAWPEFRYVVAVDVAGSHAAILVDDGQEYTLEMLDVSDPEVPTRIGFAELGGQGVPGEPSVKLAGDLAVVALGRRGLRVVDVSDPRAPREVGALETVSGVFDVVVEDELAYAVAWENGLRVLDVSDPGDAHEVGHFDPPEYVTAVDVADGVAYVCERDLVVLDVTDPTHLVEIARVAVPDQDTGVSVLEGSARGILVDGETAYVSTSAADLIVLDVTDPSEPVRLGEYQGNGNGGPVVVRAGLAYVAAGWGGMEIVDVSDPARPVELGVFQAPGGPDDGADPNRVEAALDVLVDDDIAYVAWGEDGLYAVDVSDPRAPRLVTQYEPTPLSNYSGVRVTRLAESDGLLLLATGDGAVDTIHKSALLVDRGSQTTPPQPMRRVVFTHGVNQSMQVVGDKLYVAASYAGLRIMDRERALGR